MKKNKNNGPPSVLAFEKNLAPSDGYMYGVSWNNRHDTQMEKPLKLQEKAVRGTISNRLKGREQDKLESKIENPNLQTVDICSLGANQDTLKLKFTLKVLGDIEKPSSCNNPEFTQKCTTAVKKYTKEYGFSQLASRYAHNLACARFLWRNRVGAEKIEVRIKILGSSESDSDNTPEELVFDAHKIDMNDFDLSAQDKNLKKISEKIDKAFSSDKGFLLLEVEAYALLGSKQEVYPSEELILDKEKSKKGSKSKVLYSVDQNAAMHSQKIGNALRTIDTWYPNFDEHKVGPIAIEPYGAVTNLGVAYRNPKEKCDFYSLFDKWILEDEKLSEEEQHYVIAVLIRGGVFGGTNDKKSKGEE